MTDATVAIAGGGLAGLVAARNLAESGIDVALFEANDDVGGRVRTREREGFRLDRGFQVLFTAYPAVQRALDLDALDLRRFDPGATIARPGRRSVLADPFRDPKSLLGSALNRDVTLGDKFRTLSLRREFRGVDLDSAARSWPTGDTEGSIREALQERGFSTAFLENFAAPFYGGIALDRTLSNTSAFVFRYTFAALSSGATAVPAAGMGTIPAQLADGARAAGAHIETGREVTTVSASGGDDPSRGVTLSIDGETVEADAAIVATDPPTARDLSGIDAIPSTGRGSVTQYLSVPRETALDGSRRLLLNPTEEGPNQVAPLSSVAPEYAPDGRSLLSATYLGSPDDGDEALTERTRETLESWYPALDFGAMTHRHTDRINFAQFDQPPGFRAALPDVDAPSGGVFLAGDYTRWSSIQGAMASGQDAAGAVLDFVAGP